MKNQFLKDTSTAVIGGIPNGTFLIYRDGYKLPELKNVEYIEHGEFKTKYSTIEASMYILVGLNRIITPSNRCDMVNEYLQTMTMRTPKVSIDTSPFIGEPWRLWFHYSVTNTGKFNITYSYAIETEWQHWFYRDSQTCRLAAENIGMFIDNTYSDLPNLNTKFEFYEPEAMHLEWYQEAKEHIFSKYDTPKLLINNLLKLSNKRFSLDASYDSYRTNKNIILPDLGIYKFIVEENIRRMKIYNEVINHENI